MLDLLAQFAGPSIVISVAGALAAAACARPSFTAVHLVGLAAVLIAMQPQLDPATPVAAPAPTVRVFFNNAFIGNTEPGRLAESIAAADPDVIAMVEVGPRHLQAIQSLFPRYPYRVISVRSAYQRQDNRILIASRFPLTLRANDRTDGLAATEVDVAAPGLPFRLVAAHLTRPWPFQPPGRQVSQADRLVNRIAAGQPTRTLLVGDFNAVGAAALLSAFSDRTGLILGAAPTGTWPSVLPSGLRLAIDNAFAGRDLAIIRRDVGRDTGSDHRPLLLLLRPALLSALR